MSPADRLIITCEHGGNRIPSKWRRLFTGHDRLLASHRGYDPGALDLARSIRRTTGAPLIKSDVSRLLVELNRSLDHPRLFSEVTRRLPDTDRQEILDTWYHPYRTQVSTEIERMIDRGHTVWHLSVHTFTPALNGRQRRADVGILYDPARRDEKALVHTWLQVLSRTLPRARVWRNYPYRGWSDGFTTSLRQRFCRGYLGIELEVNQAIMRTEARKATCARGIADSVREIAR